MRQFKSCPSLFYISIILLSSIVSACSSLPATQTQLAESPKPAEFEVGSITFDPPVVTTSDSLHLAATIKNVGNVAGTYSATLSVDAREIDNRQITLSPQQTSDTEFTINTLPAGNHTISIGESHISINVLPVPKKIAFSQYYGDYYSWDICTANADGTSVMRITKSGAVDLHPSWSPDGTKIAFQSTRESHNLNSIYITDADGNNVTCLTPEPKICRFPVWSPDGSKIAYCIMRKGGTGSWSGTVLKVSSAEILPDLIFIMSPDGSNKVTAANGWCPSWLPDSRQIAFLSNRTGIWEIYSKDIYGSDITKLVSLPKAKTRFGLPLPYSEFPVITVSPDGKSIAVEYSDNSPGGNQDIYVLLIDTGELKNLTGKLDGNCYAPTWSPDSTEIAFTLDNGNETDIYTINADGNNLTKLIVNGYYADWQR
jgi:hypothetical protein